MTVYHHYDIEKDGEKFRVEYIVDEHMGPPWDEFDVHGPVRTQPKIRYSHAKKRPGEVILSNKGDYAVIYDREEALKIARRDGWRPHKPIEGTKRQIAAKAVEDDMAYLRGWVNDDWHWTGVQVFPLTKDGDELRSKAESLWGIESNAEEYLKEVAFDLLGSIIYSRSNLEPQT